MSTAPTLQRLFDVVKPFLGRSQLSAIHQGLRGEERDFFREKLAEYAGRVSSMPKTYGQDGNDDAIAYLHYFTSAFDWYITERDIEPEQLQAFGVAYLGRNPELGYINLVELVAAGAELNLYFTPTKLSEIEKLKA